MDRCNTSAASCRHVRHEVSCFFAPSSARLDGHNDEMTSSSIDQLPSSNNFGWERPSQVPSVRRGPAFDSGRCENAQPPCPLVQYVSSRTNKEWILTQNVNVPIPQVVVDVSVFQFYLVSRVIVDVSMAQNSQEVVEQVKCYFMN